MIHPNIIAIAKSIHTGIMKKHPDKDFVVRYHTPYGSYDITISNANPIDNGYKFNTLSFHQPKPTHEPV